MSACVARNRLSRPSLLAFSCDAVMYFGRGSQSPRASAPPSLSCSKPPTRLCNKPETILPNVGSTSGAARMDQPLLRSSLSKVRAILPIARPSSCAIVATRGLLPNHRLRTSFSCASLRNSSRQSDRSTSSSRPIISDKAPPVRSASRSTLAVASGAGASRSVRLKSSRSISSTARKMRSPCVSSGCARLRCCSRSA